MKFLPLAGALVVSMLASGCGRAGLCELVKCGDGLECAPSTGKCVIKGTSGGGTGGGSGGGTGAVDAGSSLGCPMTCGGSTPVCDGTAQKCVVCSATAGCSGATPVCDTRAEPAGKCVGCRSFIDCQGESMDCDLDTHTCYQFDAGFGSSGEGPVQFDDAGITQHCANVPIQTPMCDNSEDCPRGYGCISGVCVLNGQNGPVQVTLRWAKYEDLDLYVVVPLPQGGTCELYYGQTNQPPPVLPIPIPIPLPKPCGAQAWLDRDADAACKMPDQQHVENVITPSSVQPTKGKYTVRANFFQSCLQSVEVPYEVEVRANGQTRYFCGKFYQSSVNGGNSGAGRVVTEFTIL